MDQEKLRELLNEQLPNVFGRKAVDRLLPGVISAKTLANYESEGRGPDQMRLGRTVVYCKQDFIDWLIDRATREYGGVI